MPWPINRLGAEPFRRIGRWTGEEAQMEKRKEEDLPHRKGEDAAVIEREAEKSRKALDEIPEPGTDPLHEGP